jgi:hypothetical protein
MQNGVLYLMHSSLQVLVEDFWNVSGVLDVHLVVARVNSAFDPIKTLQELRSNHRDCSKLGLDVCTLMLNVLMHLMIHHQADEGVFEVLLGE